MQTEFPFSLPRGFVDEGGQLHRNGRIRLATAHDEISAMQDPRVRQNAYFLPVVLLSQVVVELGSLAAVTPAIIQSLFASDIAYLQEMYLFYNSPTTVMLGAICPHCQAQFTVQTLPLG